METEFCCPRCYNVLRWDPDTTTDMMTCPRCQVLIHEPPVPEPTSRQGVSQALTGGGAGLLSGAWKSVAHGLLVHVLSVLLHVVAALVVVAEVLSAWTAGEFGGRPSAALCLQDLALVLGVIALLLCRSLPADCGFRPLATVALLLLGGVAVKGLLEGYTVGLLLDRRGWPRAPAGLLDSTLYSCCVMIGWTCLAMYLREIALTLNDEGLARKWLAHLCWTAGFFVFFLFASIVLPLPQNRANLEALGLAILLGLLAVVLVIVLGIGLLVWYLLLVLQTRSAIRARLP